MGVRWSQQRVGVDHRRFRSPRFIFVSVLVGDVVLCEGGLRQPIGNRPRQVEVVFFKNHYDLKPKRKVAVVPFSHHKRGDEIGDLGSRPVVPPVGVADGAATETVAAIDPAPAARAVLGAGSVMEADGPARTVEVAWHQEHATVRQQL